MNEFPEIFDLNAGDYVETFVKWLTTDHMAVFDSIRDGILAFLLRMQSIISFIPWFVIIGIVFIAGWRLKGVRSGLFYTLMLLTIGLLGYWNDTLLTISIVLTAVIISLVIGIPFGILSANYKRMDNIVRPVLDAMQTMPSFVYLIPAIMLFGLGMVPAVFATTIYALPPVIRLTTLAINSVSKEMIEAAESFGPTPWQALLKVELPQAMPTIMAGVNQTTMMAMAMVVVSSMIGAKGLGYSVLIAINRTDIAMGFDAGISIVFLAIIIDRLTQSIGDKFRHDE